MINLLTNKRYRIFILSTILGIVLTLVEFIMIRFMMIGTNEWTLEMGDFIFYTNFALSFGAVLIIGLFFLKDMNKKEIGKSSLIMVMYYILLLIFERLIFTFEYNSLYSLYIWLLYPIKIYSSMTQLLVKLFSNIWIAVILTIPTPFIFLLFGKKQSIKINDH